MLSVEAVFYRPKEKQAIADQKKAKFHQPEVRPLAVLARGRPAVGPWTRR